MIKVDMPYKVKKINILVKKLVDPFYTKCNKTKPEVKSVWPEFQGVQK